MARRIVRTAAGAKKFGVPIGSPIPSGKEAVQNIRRKAPDKKLGGKKMSGGRKPPGSFTTDEMRRLVDSGSTSDFLAAGGGLSGLRTNYSPFRDEYMNEFERAPGGRYDPTKKRVYSIQFLVTGLPKNDDDRKAARERADMYLTD